MCGHKVSNVFMLLLNSHLKIHSLRYLCIKLLYEFDNYYKNVCGLNSMNKILLKLLKKNIFIIKNNSKDA